MLLPGCLRSGTGSEAEICERNHNDIETIRLLVLKNRQSMVPCGHQ